MDGLGREGNPEGCVEVRMRILGGLQYNKNDLFKDLVLPYGLIRERERERERKGGGGLFCF